MLYPKVVDIRTEFVRAWRRYKENPRLEVSGTIELLGASFVADEETIFGELNQDYIERELEWYESQSLYVKDIPGKTPTIWEAVSSDTGKINSNYGWLLHSPENYGQYEHVRKQLLVQPEGRRAVAVYTRPSMHFDWNVNGMSDFVCTNAVNYYQRRGYLYAVVQMRSNDAVFGFRNDYAWQKHVLHELAEDIQARPGGVIWQPGSLHVYSRHYHLIEEYVDTGNPFGAVVKADA